MLGLLCMGGVALNCGGPKSSTSAVPPAATARGAQATTPTPTPPLVPPGQATRVTFETPTGPQHVMVEVAATPQARRKGLMGRKTLAPGHGMLFVFDRQKVHTFWMRNTLISLDMIFIAGEPSGANMRVVGVVHEALPHSTEIRSVEPASRFVVEVPGGWAGDHAIGAGVAVRFDAPGQ
ncbi:MAG: DUF192 domain-containing protein [Myxococcota bacterium]|nr:DUF192 domain-containing protein [Myxococcota bacterium]